MLNVPRPLQKKDRLFRLLHGLVGKREKSAISALFHYYKKKKIPFIEDLGLNTFTSFIFHFLFFCIFRTTLAAYGDSQARGLIGAVAASLCQSHSNTRSQPHLHLHHSSWQHWILNPLEQGQGSNPKPHGS